MAELTKILASSEITIVDETDASTLTSSLQVVKGSRNQIFLTGQDNPYSPDWSKANLVIRPFLQASNIKNDNALGVEYNPDLFDPKEYPRALYDGDYIRDIHWYYKDTSGVETEIYDSDNYSFSYTYNIGEQVVTCNDHRQLVIKNNVLSKNSTGEIIVKYGFYDPLADVYINQQNSITLTNIASGQGNSKLLLTAVNGNAINNTGEQYIDLLATFYGDSGIESISTNIDDGAANTSCLWYIRNNNEWKLLDPSQSGQNNANESAMMYNIMRIKSTDTGTGSYQFESSYNVKGNEAIRIYPALIDGSEVIKCVYTTATGEKFASVEVVYDNTDTTKVEIYSSAGTRLKRNNNIGTTLKAVVTYKGELLEENSPLYNTEFDYYWYKYTFNDDKIVNVFNNESNKLVENDDTSNPIVGKRILYVSPDDIDMKDKQTKLLLDLAEKAKMMAATAQASFYAKAITEEDLNTAMIINSNVGIKNDIEAAIYTAKELNAVSNIDDKE